MTMHTILAPHHIATVERGRAVIQPLILLEAERQQALHDLRLDPEASAETIQMAEDAVGATELLVATAFMDFAADCKALARAEITKEQEQDLAPGAPHSVRRSA